MGLDIRYSSAIIELKGCIANLTTYIIMDKETKELIRQLTQRVELIIALMLRLLPKKEISFREQVSLLNDLKIRPMDISKITGRSQGHINKELVAIRKKK